MTRHKKTKAVKTRAQANIERTLEAVYEHDDLYRAEYYPPGATQFKKLQPGELAVCAHDGGVLLLLLVPGIVALPLKS